MNAFEAAYKEQYALWTGPYRIGKTIKAAEGLLVDFADIAPYADTVSGSPNRTSAPDWQTVGEPDKPGNEIIRKRGQNRAAE